MIQCLCPSQRRFIIIAFTYPRKAGRGPLRLLFMKEKVTKDAEAVENHDENLVYELGYHLLVSVSEEDLPKEVAAIHFLLAESGGTIISEGLPVIQPLAYVISKKIDTKNIKFSKAFFGWVKFEMGRDKVVNFNAKIEVLPNILRSILIKTVKENTAHTLKAPLVRKETSRDEALVVAEEKPVVSEEEIDKSIDELLVTGN